MAPVDWDDPGEYDPETHTYRFNHDWTSDERVSTTIVYVVAALTNTPPTSIEPLYETVNPDALDHLFFPTTTEGCCRSDATLRFTFHDCDITVANDGSVVIHLPDES